MFNKYVELKRWQCLRTAASFSFDDGQNDLILDFLKVELSSFSCHCWFLSSASNQPTSRRMKDDPVDSALD